VFVIEETRSQHALAKWSFGGALRLKARFDKSPADPLHQAHNYRGTSMDKTQYSRRKVIKGTLMGLAVAPLVGFSGRSLAAQNAAIRAALKYQSMPSGDKQCKVCVNFVPNKDKPDNDGDINGCKLYPGDTEICPHCYCTGFVKKPA
jgi:hypothetical protein